MVTGSRLLPGTLMTRCNGPIVIVGRPRSGTRVLTHLLRENGICMGTDLDPHSLDSRPWYWQFVVPLLTNKVFNNRQTAEFRQLAQEQARHALQEFWKNAVRSSIWGWKVCEALFLIPTIKELFPFARFIHIIRDGRDVCLSRRGFFQLTDAFPPPNWCSTTLNASFHDFCVVSTFGRLGVRKWRHLDLAVPSALAEHRFLLQMKSWITCVKQARSYGHTLGADYFELRYEALCQQPAYTADRLSSWLKMPVSELHGIHTDRIHQWPHMPLSNSERRDFKAAAKLAYPLLKSLAYV